MGAAHIIIPTIENIAEYKGWDWDDCLEMLHDIKQYDESSLRKEEIHQIDILINKLTKTDFVSRYIDVSDKIRREHGYSDFEKVTNLPYYLLH